MSKLSRRQLARYAADGLLSRQPSGVIAKNLAAALLASHNEKDADLLMADIGWEMENRGKLAAAHITSAHELPANLKDQLAKQLRTSLKTEELNLTTEIDSSVIGGLKIQTSKTTWDKTIAAQLKQLKEVL